MKSEQKTLLLQAGLFIATVITTTIAGAEWVYGKSIYMPGYTWQDFLSGFQFSVPFLLILTVHEFGHYFTARYHKVGATLPYYLPLPPFQLSLGTLGALIRLKTRPYSTKQNFDIGIAGPLAGFVMAIIVLTYGFTTLPEADYVFQFHPEYKQYGQDYAEVVYKNLPENAVNPIIGKNLLFMLFEKFVADPTRVPNPQEMMHYPILLAGFLSLVFTSLNLLPVGQLDGGHVVYGLFGFKAHRIIATVFFIAFLLYASLGVFDVRDPSAKLHIWIPMSAIFLYVVLSGLGLAKRDTLMYALIILAFLLLMNWFFPTVTGYPGWLLFVFVLARGIGIQHPPSEVEEPLDTKRVVLGWIALLIFIISFSPTPL
jgi:membrane-associated protease RseP (regulator of RpoE activity)